MLLCKLAAWVECAKACAGGEKFFESIGALRVAIGASSAESQGAASATVSDIFI